MKDGKAEEGFSARDHLDVMKRLIGQGGVGAVDRFIGAFASPSERRQLWALAHRAFGQGDWEGKTLDAVIELGRAAVAEGLRQAEAENDPEEAARRLDFANVMSYNLAADLAPCWPGDDQPRETRHLEAGLAAAEDCLRWRDQLGKGPGPRSMAWWAKGIHLLGLGRIDEALDAFEKQRELSRQDAAAQGQGAEVDESGHWSVLLGEGYVRLAQLRRGDDDGRARFDELQDLIGRAAQAQPEASDDLAFCRDQLAAADACRPCASGGS